MRSIQRIAAGLVLVGAAWLWKLKGTRGEVVAHLGPLPDLNAGDLVTIPVLLAGLVLLAGSPGLPWWRRLCGVACLAAAVLWVTSELPWDDPLIPGLRRGRHGAHLLDVAAVVPLGAAVVLLTPSAGRLLAQVRRRRCPVAAVSAGRGR